MSAAGRLPVFVYGTLRAGEKNYAAYLAGRTRREEPATVAGTLYFLAGEGYPCLLPGNGRVRGELMELLPERYETTLRELDALEEYDPADEARSVYLRRSARVAPEGGGEVQAWVYYWNGPPPPGEPLADDDFRRR